MQAHFDSDMWKVVNNERRLKEDAIPTLFPSPPVRKRKSTTVFVKPEKKVCTKALFSKTHIVMSKISLFLF